MPFRWRRAAGISVITLALIFLVLGAVMSFYKSPQRLERSGPGVQFTSLLPYWINSYFIPPIDSGSQIYLNVLSNRAGATTVLLAPYDQNTQSIIGPALLNVAFDSSQKGLVVYTRATRSGPYLLTITSYNSTFDFSITSVWSPFYAFRSLTIAALALFPLGAIAVYYDKISERREKMAYEALKGIRKIHQP